MNSLDITVYFERFKELQQYVGWSDQDETNINQVQSLISVDFDLMIDDFYDAISKSERARRVITGGEAQITQLKKSLRVWIDQLFSGVYDEDYVYRRLKVGQRHVEIGLELVYTNVAMCRLRNWITRSLTQRHQNEKVQCDLLVSVNRLLDLDLAIIDDAYQMHYLAEQKKEERFATIGKISGGIAHEIRNPLNVVKTSIYYLNNAKSATDEKKQQHMSRIESAIDESNRIITALSDFSRVQSPRLAPVSLEKLVYQSIAKNLSIGEEMNEPTIETNGLKISVSHSLTDDMVLADSAQLQIVLGNLIRNARQAMDDRGEIAINICEYRGKKTVTVVDNGPGISDENLSQILEPLFTTKAKGIGLGLAISKAILDGHKAELVVESRDGEGTRFLILFPLREMEGDVT